MSQKFTTYSGAPFTKSHSSPPVRTSVAMYFFSVEKGMRFMTRAVERSSR